MGLTTNPDGTVTRDQAPGVKKSKGTPIQAAPLAQPVSSKGPKVVKQPGRGVTGKGGN